MRPWWHIYLVARRIPQPSFVIVYLPSMGNLRLLRRLKATNGVIYDAVLDWGNVPPDWFPPRRWRDAEREILALPPVSVAWTDSAVLAERLPKGDAPPVVLLPVADEEFVGFPWGDYERPGAPKCGYFGTVRASEIDVDYLCELSARWKVEIVGVVEPGAHAKLADAGAAILPAVPIEELLNLVAGWTDIVLPYREGPRTQTLVPAKIANALATGLPVHVRGLVLPPPFRDSTVALPRDANDFVAGTEVRCPPAHSPSWSDSIERALVESGVAL